MYTYWNSITQFQNSVKRRNITDSKFVRFSNVQGTRTRLNCRYVKQVKKNSMGEIVRYLKVLAQPGKIERHSFLLISWLFSSFNFCQHTADLGHRSEVSGAYFIHFVEKLVVLHCVAIVPCHFAWMQVYLDDIRVSSLLWSCFVICGNLRAYVTVQYSILIS